MEQRRKQACMAPWPGSSSSPAMATRARTRTSRAGLPVAERLARLTRPRLNGASTQQHTTAAELRIELNGMSALILKRSGVWFGRFSQTSPIDAPRRPATRPRKVAGSWLISLSFAWGRGPFHVYIIYACFFFASTS